jgi:hypothetical protein
LRPKALTLVLATAALVAALFPGVSVAAPDESGIYPMIFPVQGANYYTDTFGACRSGCTRPHEGQDIMTYGVKGVPVVAVAAGEVVWISESQSECCFLGIRHDDGWVTRYIHLNNDSPGTDDGQTWGIAPGLTDGSEVEAGQLIGWVGDSGNAEGVNPHLHFELRSPSNVAYNPYASLQAAQPVPNQEPPCPVETNCDTAAFQDVGGRFHFWDELAWGSDVTSFFYGNPGDIPFSGDWDADGVETLGLYRRSDGYVYLRNTNTQGIADISFYFGNPGDLPIAGDFDGDGDDTVSIYRPSEARFYIINELGSNDGGLGAAEYSFLFGNVGDKPFVGDFDGDGVDTIGLHRESTGLVYFRDTNSTGVADSQFIYGNPGDKIVAGDWDGDGDDTVAVYRPADGRFYLRLSNTQGNADVTLYAGVKTGVVAIDP